MKKTKFLLNLKKWRSHRFPSWTRPFLSGLAASALLITLFQNCSPSMQTCDGIQCGDGLDGTTGNSRSLANSLGSSRTTGGSASSQLGGSFSYGGPSSTSSTGGGSSSSSSNSGNNPANTNSNTNTNNNTNSDSPNSDNDGADDSTIKVTNPDEYEHINYPHQVGDFQFQLEPQKQKAEVGEEVAFGGYASDGINFNITYQWYRSNTQGDQPLAGSTGPTLKIGALKAEDANYSYFIVANNGTNSIMSEKASIKLIPTRNSCAPGFYGLPLDYNGSWETAVEKLQASKEIIFHGSENIGHKSALYFGTEVYDSHIVLDECAFDKQYFRSNSPFLTASCGGRRSWQCQNGKLILVGGGCGCGRSSASDQSGGSRGNGGHQSDSDNR